MDKLALNPGPPGDSYTVTIRVSAPPHPALLPRLGQAISSVGAVVVGMVFGRVPGFIILDDHADLTHGDWGSGEELQDHACALGH